MVRNSSRVARFAPLHPRLAGLGFRAALPLATLFFQHKNIHRPNGPFAARRAQELAARLARGETCYLVGLSIGGFHNTGTALIEATPAGGLRIICNNEEERFSGQKHSNAYPRRSLEALAEIIEDLGISPERIVAWLATYDYPLLMATGMRTILEEFPASLRLASENHSPTYDGGQLKEGVQTPARLGQLFSLVHAVPIIGMPHHDNHAWFSYLVSPFARDRQK